MAVSNVTVLARRALVVSAAALVVAIIALVAALLGGTESDPAESDGAEPAQADAAAVQAEAEQAAVLADASAARADASAVLADASVARAAAAAEALAAALVEADGDVDPAVVAELEALLAEAQADAAAAAVQAAADEATAAGEAPASETPPEDPDAAGDGSQQAAEDESEPASPATTVPLPGAPSEFGPSAGAGLAVVGVAYNSTLNVRDVPNGEVIARLSNLMDGVRDPVLLVRAADSDAIVVRLDLLQGVVATGNTRQLTTTVWHEFQFGEAVGWSSSAFLAPLGAQRDATAEVVEALGGIPTADTLEDLGLQIAGVFSSSGEVQSRTTISSRPGVFEAVGDITVDVVGLPDDAVRGYRISIAADAGAEDWTQADPGPFTLRFAGVTPICDAYRGVSEEGLCL